MNLTSLVNSFLTAASYTVTRTARGTVVRGRVVEGTQTSVTISASVSPVDGLSISRNPEGQTDEQTRTLFTTTELYAGGQGASYEADKVTIDGDLWEVSRVEKWVDSSSRGTCYKCKLVRE